MPFLQPAGSTPHGAAPCRSRWMWATAAPMWLRCPLQLVLQCQERLVACLFLPSLASTMPIMCGHTALPGYWRHQTTRALQRRVWRGCWCPSIQTSSLPSVVHELKPVQCPVLPSPLRTHPSPSSGWLHADAGWEACCAASAHAPPSPAPPCQQLPRREPSVI